jgi:exodeoxyribonuclease-5
MSSFIFTPDQEKTIQEAVDWYKYSSKQTFEIAGEAGTGKSVVLNEIVRRLNLSPNEYMPMAFTGQAAIIMRLKGFQYAKSIHSSLYEYIEELCDPIGFESIDTRFNRPKVYKIFRPKPRYAINDTVKMFIIDEAYMTPKEMRRVIDSFDRKVLVAGDDKQLPPVVGEPAYLTGEDIHRLTTLMRQEEDNPIVYIAHRARQGLPIHCGMYGNRVLVIEDKDLNDRLLSLPQAIICGTNYTRDTLNQYIRTNLKHIYRSLPAYGERVICRDNNWQIERDNISLANGLVGTVINQPGVGGFNGQTFDMDFVPDLTGSVFDGLEVDYKYFTASYEERKVMKNLEYKVGERFEFAYALTTYLCQGAEYHTPMYIEEFIRPNVQNQLNYSGITRAKQNLIYVKKSKQFYSLFG